MSYEDDAVAGAPIEQHRMSAEDERWQSEYEKWQQSRLDRVQTSARSWLGLLTGLLGLLGSIGSFAPCHACVPATRRYS